MTCTTCEDKDKQLHTIQHCNFLQRRGTAFTNLLLAKVTLPQRTIPMQIGKQPVTPGLKRIQQEMIPKV